MLHLLTHEKQKLAFFIEQSRQTQADIIAKADRTVSGPLILAYKLLFENIR